MEKGPVTYFKYRVFICKAFTLGIRKKLYTLFSSDPVARTVWFLIALIVGLNAIFLQKSGPTYWKRKLSVLHLLMGIYNF